jgi:hypothetical protein
MNLMPNRINAATLRQSVTMVGIRNTRNAMTNLVTMGTMIRYVVW